MQKSLQLKSMECQWHMFSTKALVWRCSHCTNPITLVASKNQPKSLQVKDVILSAVHHKDCMTVCNDQALSLLFLGPQHAETLSCRESVEFSLPSCPGAPGHTRKENCNCTDHETETSPVGNHIICGISSYAQTQAGAFYSGDCETKSECAIF